MNSNKSSLTALPMHSGFPHSSSSSSSFTSADCDHHNIRWHSNYLYYLGQKILGFNPQGWMSCWECINQNGCIGGDSSLGPYGNYIKNISSSSASPDWIPAGTCFDCFSSSFTQCCGSSRSADGSSSSSSSGGILGYCCGVTVNPCFPATLNHCTQLGYTWYASSDECIASCAVSMSSVSSISSSVSSISSSVSSISSSVSSASSSPSASALPLLIGGCCYWKGTLATQDCSDTTKTHCVNTLKGSWYSETCGSSTVCVTAVIASSMEGPVVTCRSCSPSSESSSSSSSSDIPKPSPFPEGLCPIFSVDDEEIRGPWENRDPDHNRNLTITQGDTVCYRIAVYENGAAVDLRSKELKSYVKIRFSDYSHVEKFNVLLVPGTTNVIELSLSARQTTCLPVTELVYSCEIMDSSDIQKVIQGYLRVLPEVTRDTSFCAVYGFSPVPKPSSSSSSSASAECCAKYWVRKIQLGANYIFYVEVPTEEAVYKDISYWEAELTTNPSASDSFNEVEHIQNEINPNNVAFGYEMIYPIGNGRYRFIDKQKFITNGFLDSVFSVPIPMATYNNALVRVRHFSNGGCATDWCQATMVNEAEVYTDCCPSSSISTSSSSISSFSSSSSSLPGVPPVEQVSSSMSWPSSSSSAIAVAACCLPNGNCIHVTANPQGVMTCGLMGGTYIANKKCHAGICTSSSSPSASAPAPAQSMAACCFPRWLGEEWKTSTWTPEAGRPSCHPVTNDFDGWWACVVTHAGDFFASFTCADSPCTRLGGTPPQPSTAACCLPDGDCITVGAGFQGEHTCQLLGGIFNASKTCSPNPCSSPSSIITATCCLNGNCTNMEDNLNNFLNCVVQGGEYTPNTNCTTHPCIQSSSSSPAPPLVNTTFTITVSNIASLAYSLNGVDRLGALGGWNPSITINVGDTLNIELVNNTGHPFWIKTVQGTGSGNGAAGATNNGAESGSISWTPTAAGTYYYNCQHHAAMTAVINVL